MWFQHDTEQQEFVGTNEHKYCAEQIQLPDGVNTLGRIFLRDNKFDFLIKLK